MASTSGVDVASIIMRSFSTAMPSGAARGALSVASAPSRTDASDSQRLLEASPTPSAREPSSTLGSQPRGRGRARGRGRGLSSGPSGPLSLNLH